MSRVLALLLTREKQPAWVVHIAAFGELLKPRIALMVLLTATVGFSCASEGTWDYSLWLHAMLGIALVAAGSASLNQWIERDTDALMVRTMSRPLPSGRLKPWEVLLAGIALGSIGTAWLVVFVNPLAGLLTLSTLLLYAGVYTPMKRTSSLCTAVGAVPGAMPPVLGWAAASGALLDGGWESAEWLGPLSLFGILFLWQFPHFLAIAWMYRDQYRRAGLKMLPNSPAEPIPHVTGLAAVAYACVLIPVSLLPGVIGLAGDFYSGSALALGVIYLGASIQFARQESRESARSLLWISLMYLPTVLGILVCDQYRLLGRFDAILGFVR